jgi:N-acetylglutamate synthase-like GNAT family acetyltransferase
MTPSQHRVRRATQDDHESLKALWSLMRLPVDALGRQLTEFQVAESADGRVVGALGIQIAGQQGRLHSESYLDFAIADELRLLLMERLRSLASNHGVLRLWTQEQSPFWTRQGFHPASAEELKKLPEAWAGLGAGWLTLQLKDEAAIISMEKELAFFMETEKQRTAQILQRVQTLKTAALWVAMVLGIFVLGAAIYLLLKNPKMLPPLGK